MIRIYADFNSCDEQGRVFLNTVGSLRDIERQSDLVSVGEKVILYVPDDFEVVGELEFDRVWLAVPDWKTMKRT